jgi:protein TonB
LLSTIEKPAAKEARPIAPAPKPEPVKDATPEPAPSRPAASESRTLASVAPERRVKTIHRDRREATGATAASQKAIGRPGHDDIVYVTEAHYREPPMPPRYPKRARELNQEGEALLQVRLDYEGNAQEILISQSSGYVLLDNAALAAARRWQFEPERRNGRPVIAWVRIPVRFSLN